MPLNVEMTPGRVVLGSLDTQLRYLRRRDVTGAVPLLTGPNWDLLGVSNNGARDQKQPRYAGGGRVDPRGGPASTSTAVDVGVNVDAPGGGSLEVSPAGITIRDPATGRLLHDPSAPLMHVLHEIVGSLAMPSRNASGAGYEATVDTVVATISPRVSHVVGAVRTDYGGTPQPSNSVTGDNPNHWWTLNGTFVSFWQLGSLGTGQAAGQVISGTPTEKCAWSQIDFLPINGRLIIRELTQCYRLFAGGQFNPVGGGSVASYVRQPYTLHYRLKCVAFS